MTTSTYIVMSAFLALFLGAALLPALNIFRVDSRGLGHEHAHPWRSKAKAIAGAALMAAATWFGRLRARAADLIRHPLFSPAATAAVVLVAFFIHGAALLAAPAIFGVLTEGTHTAEFLVWEANPLKREVATVLSGQNLASGAVAGRVTLGIGRVSIPTVVATASANGTASLVFAGPEVEVGNYVLTCITAVAHGGVWTLTTPGGKSLPNFTMTPGAGGTTAYTSRHINFSITDGSTDFAAGDVFTFVVGTTVPTVIGGTGSGVLSALSLGPDAKPGRYKINNDVVVANGGDMSVIGPDGNQVGGRFIWAASGSTASFTSRQINFTISDATDYIANNYFDVAVYNTLSGGKVVAWDPTTFDGRHVAVGVLYAAIDASSADKAGVLVTRDAVVMKSALSWGASITSSQRESAYADLAKRGVIARDGVTY